MRGTLAAAGAGKGGCFRLKPRPENDPRPKYQQLYEALKADVLSGKFRPSGKLPSEAALVLRSGASRITVGRALRELQDAGLVYRVAGSGTFVRDREESESQPYLFGLLIPDLGETEVFEHICAGIANAPEARDHAMLWGHVDAGVSKPEQAWRLCRQYVSRHVAGVFFAPLEFEKDAVKMNRRIVAALREAEIAVVLLDHRHSPAPERWRPDLVGIHNRQAGYIATEHLIELGCRRIGFVGYHGAASTISERMAGYQDALAASGIRPAMDSPGDWGSASEADAIVCVNDRIAAQMMQLFLARGVRVPDDIRLVGIDDVSYAELLPVPLTTVRQPTRAIGEAALRAMLARIKMPHLPPQEWLLDGQLIIRKSCGADR